MSPTSYRAAPPRGDSCTLPVCCHRVKGEAPRQRMDHVDHVADIEPLPLPTRSSGPRVHHDPCRIVLRFDIAHRVRRYPRRSRHIRHDATIRLAEAKLTIGLSIDLIPLLVNRSVVAAAEQDK